MIELVDINYLIRVVLIAIGISYVITGSQIGFPLRLLWWYTTGWIPLLGLEALAFCPSCNAWWGALTVALLTGSSFWISVQCAFVACGVAAMVQSQFGLAAADEDRISGIFNRQRGGDDGKTNQS